MDVLKFSDSKITKLYDKNYWYENIYQFILNLWQPDKHRERHTWVMTTTFDLVKALINRYYHDKVCDCGHLIMKQVIYNHHVDLHWMVISHSILEWVSEWFSQELRCQNGTCNSNETTNKYTHKIYNCIFAINCIESTRNIYTMVDWNLRSM